MVKMYYDKDANWEMLNGKTIAIIGYGSQGHAHALNLKESGAKVIVGLYEGCQILGQGRSGRSDCYDCG